MSPRLLLALLLPLSITAHAEPPPELAALQQQYEKAVLVPHQEALAALNAKFSSALENAIAQAKQAGRLEDVLSLQQDQKRLSEKLPLPEDDAATPDAQKKLRAIYRDQFAKLEAQRQASQTSLLPAYAARLKELEATLTRADRIDEALEVKTYRETLALAGPTAAPTSTAAPVPLPIPPAPAGGKGDDRAAAELILSLGGKVRLTGSDETIATADKLPKGKFSLQSISCTVPGQRQLEEKDAATLSHLERLESFEASRTIQNDEALSFLATCPALKRVNVQNGGAGLTGSWITFLAPLKQLEMLFIIEAARQDVSALTHLPGENLVHLHLRNIPVDDGTLAVIMRFSKLRALGLRRTRVTDAGIRHLSSLKELDEINLTETDVTLEGLRHLAGAKLTALGFGLTPDHMQSALPELARLFPRVTTVYYPTGGASHVPSTSAHLAALGRAWPKLRRMDFPSYSRFDPDAFALVAPLFPALEQIYLWQCPQLTDQHIAGIAQMKKVASLEVSECSELTDACLPHLQSMRSLKRLYISRTKVTAAAIATLRKARPDMKIEP